MNLAEQLKNEIASLKEALVSGNPGMPAMLRTIHTNLKQDPTLVTLLEEDEIGILVSGMMKQTNTVIATKAAKSSSNTKKLSKLSLDDL